MDCNVRANPHQQSDGIKEAIPAVDGVENLGFAGQQHLLGQKPVTIQRPVPRAVPQFLPGGYR